MEKEMEKNRYEHLLRRYVAEPYSITARGESKIIVNRSNESVRLLLVEAEPGKWVYGYYIYLEDGRELSRGPSLEYGYCVTENDAVLHFLGLLLSFRNLFSNEAVEIINNLVMQKAQLSLF